MPLSPRLPKHRSILSRWIFLLPVALLIACVRMQNWSSNPGSSTYSRRAEPAGRSRLLQDFFSSPAAEPGVSGSGSGDARTSIPRRFGAVSSVIPALQLREGLQTSTQPLRDAATFRFTKMGQSTAASSEAALCLKRELWLQQTTEPFTIDDFLKAHPARLIPELSLHSQRDRSPQAVTLLVTATVGRLDMLPGLCSSWGGVLSVAVYVGHVGAATTPEAAAVISAAKTAVRAVFAETEAAAKIGCQLDVTLFSESLADAAVAQLFPVNALRNAALLAAATPLVMLGDADLLVGSDLNTVLADPAGYAEVAALAEANKLVVVPAFQTDGIKRAPEAAFGGKQVAVKMWQDERIVMFLNGHSPAHGETDYPRWSTADAPYELGQTDAGYEPWWIASRALVAPFDVRYRGFGKNKVQQLHAHLRVLGSRFVVHHRGYMVHRPHPDSPAKAQFLAELNSGASSGHRAAAVPVGASIFATTDRWFGDQLARGAGYTPLVTPEWLACARTLPWWKANDGGEGLAIKVVTSVPAGSTAREAAA